ncbi:type II toxin-antitoxin system Phd/YefM family antitoxin [Micromonospora matsumotoense]|uniref:type II toxin-antitoxin system Phd/YefM family antitoxin n=1 Tax=Micromonospora matsumotoense TaxID=121616 RepID=UPI003D923F65
MLRFFEPMIEAEVGVRSAREQLPELLKKAESGNVVIHVTRHGRRVGAIVNSEVAEKLAAIRGVDGPVVPGDMAGVIRIVERLLIGEDDPGPDLKATASKRNELVGGCMSLVDILLAAPELQYGELRVKVADGEYEVKLVADLLIRKLYDHPGIKEIDLGVLPLIAASVWAAQVQGSAVDYRLQVPIEVSFMESYAWLIALWELCLLINVIHGDGVAEELMYNSEEFFRGAIEGA